MWSSIRVALVLTSMLAGCADHADSDPAALCAACGPDQICVQSMHSNIEDTCQSLGVRCEPRDPRCTGTVCSPDCNFWQCGGGVDAGMLSCRPGEPPCANAVVGALQCWGP